MLMTYNVALAFSWKRQCHYVALAANSGRPASLPASEPARKRWQIMSSQRSDSSDGCRNELASIGTKSSSLLRLSLSRRLVPVLVLVLGAVWALVFVSAARPTVCSAVGRPDSPTAGPSLTLPAPPEPHIEARATCLASLGASTTARAQSNAPVYKQRAR